MNRQHPGALLRLPQSLDQSWHQVDTMVADRQVEPLGPLEQIPTGKVRIQGRSDRCGIHRATLRLERCQSQQRTHLGTQGVIPGTNHLDQLAVSDLIHPLEGLLRGHIQQQRTFETLLSFRQFSLLKEVDSFIEKFLHIWPNLGRKGSRTHHGQNHRRNDRDYHLEASTAMRPALHDHLFHALHPLLYHSHDKVHQVLWCTHHCSTLTSLIDAEISSQQVVLKK